MLSLLMVMQYDLVFKGLFAIKAKWSEAAHISSFSSHSLLNKVSKAFQMLQYFPDLIQKLV